MDLAVGDIDAATGQLSDAALEGICTHLETVRGQSHAVRRLSLFRNLQQSVECLGGSVAGVGLHNAAYITLADGTKVVAYPTVGVPTSVTLNDAMENSSGQSIAVVYDHIGLHPKMTGSSGLAGNKHSVRPMDQSQRSCVGTRGLVAP